jgi:hypothetical protein
MVEMSIGPARAQRERAGQYRKSNQPLCQFQSQHRVSLPL